VVTYILVDSNTLILSNYIKRHPYGEGHNVIIDYKLILYTYESSIFKSPTLSAMRRLYSQNTPKSINSNPGVWETSGYLSNCFLEEERLFVGT
jgi:hypothetical protein